MRKLSIFIILFFCLLTVGAQQVSLQDVANRTYRACLLYTSPSIVPKESEVSNRCWMENITPK